MSGGQTGNFSLEDHSREYWKKNERLGDRDTIPTGGQNGFFHGRFGAYNVLGTRSVGKSQL